MGVPFLRAGHHINHQGRVGHRSSQHTVSGDLRHPGPARTAGNPATGRLQTNHTAICRRHSDRPAAVSSVMQRPIAGGARRCSTATRTTGGPLQIPWIRRRRPQSIHGLRRQPELGRVGLAEEDGACLTQPLDKQLVARCRPVVGDQRSHRRWNFLNVNEILDRDRDAEQRRQLLPVSQAPRQSGVARLLERQVPSLTDERIQRRLELIDALEDRGHDLFGRECSSLVPGA